MGTGTLSQPAGQALTIGLVAALPAELRCLTPDPARYYTSHPIDPHIMGIISGIGAEHAARAAGMLVKLGVRGLVSWGTAGALSPELRSGDLVLPDVVHTTDGQRLHTDTAWIRQLRQMLAGETVSLLGGTIAESQAILDTAAAKFSLGQTNGAVAVDMETAAIMRAAAAAGLPCIAIRAIVDECTDVVPSEILKHMDHYGRPDILKISGVLMRNPGLISAMVRLARAMNAATHTLKEVARKADNAFAFPFA